MSGIYIHVPLCRKACHYCDFHFSTSLKYRFEIVSALAKELALRTNEITDTVDTIYFGGGTPSLLEPNELEQVFTTLYKYYKVSSTAEITLEANPDDLSENYLKAIKSLGINRLSIGVQSFSDRELREMNRSHTAAQARDCLERTQLLFDNISIDLIYGFPKMSINQWKKNIDIALSYTPQHLSAYALTVKPRTALKRFINQNTYPKVGDTQAEKHYHILTKQLKNASYIHYEVSNFSKKAYMSRANSAYWRGLPYLGIGPSAHSYIGNKRSHNIANNIKYIQSISREEPLREIETLSLDDKYNEYVMTGLRTMWGVNLSTITNDYGLSYLEHLQVNAKKHIDNGFLILEGYHLKTSSKGILFADGICADLFIV